MTAPDALVKIFSLTERIQNNFLKKNPNNRSLWVKFIPDLHSFWFRVLNISVSPFWYHVLTPTLILRDRGYQWEAPSWRCPGRAITGAIAHLWGHLTDLWDRSAFIVRYNTGSPQYVLAVARTCKVLCQTLLSTNNQFIWREARKACAIDRATGPVCLPDPPDRVFWRGCVCGVYLWFGGLWGQFGLLSSCWCHMSLHMY